MIITCKSCEKRYFLEDGSIGGEGRTVRCVACQHTWHQVPVESDVETLSLDTFEDVMSLRKSQKSGRFQPAVGWALFVLMVMTLLGGSYLARQPIVSFWPKTAGIYTKLGIEVARPGFGLSFENITPVQVTQDGQERLVVKGDILNGSDFARNVEKVSIFLTGSCEKAGFLARMKAKLFSSPRIPKNQCVLGQWQHPLTETRLLPGERLSFETAPRPTPLGVTEMTIEF